MKYRLQDLIDMEQFQNLQDRLNEIYCFPSAIIDNDGNILTATAWQDICTQFHRKHPDCERECRLSDQYILSHLHEANPYVSYRCPHGLVDNATPIVIDGVHYGNFFTGQFFLEKPDLDSFRAQAKKYGFDEDAYLKAVEKVPVWSQEQLNSYLFFIKGLISVISESGLKKLNEVEARRKVEESEERADAILRTAMDGFWLVDMQGRLLDVNNAYCRMSGYTREELLRMSIPELEANESSDEIAAHIHQVMQEGSAQFERRHRRKDGRTIDLELSVNYLPTSGGRIFCFLRDITERKAHESEIKRLSLLYLALSQINQLITRVSTREELLDGVCQMLVKYGQLKMAWIGWLDLQTKAVISVAQDGDIGGYLKQNKIFADDSAFGQGPTGTAIRQSRTVVCNDFIRDASTEPWHEAGVRQGFGSSASFPIRFDGLVCGALTVYAGDLGFFRDKEILLFEETALDVSFALDQLEKEKQKQKAEEALRKVNERFDLAARAAHIGVWDWDIVGDKLLWDDRMYALYGVKRDNFNGAYAVWVKGLHPDDVARCEEETQQALRGEKDYETEFRVVWPDGTIRHLKAMAMILRDASGNPVREIGINTDITGQKQAEEALKHSHDLMRYIIEHNRSAIAVHDRNMRYVYVSQRYLDEYKVKEKDVIGKHHYDVFPDLPQKWRNVHRKALAGEISSAEDDPYMRADGTVDWTRWECRPWYEADDSIGGIIIYTEVITERKRAELALRESEERYRSLVEESPDAIGITQEGKLVFINSAGVRQLGAETKGELLGRKAESLIHPDDRPSAFDRIGRRLAGETGLYPAEVRYLRLDGTTIPVEVTATPITFGQASAIQFIARDITERKRAEEAQRQSESLHKAILDNIPDPAWIKEIGGRFLAVNKAWCQFTGLVREETIGKTDAELFPAEMALRFQEQDRNVVETGQPQYCEEPFRDSRDRVLMFETFKAPLANLKGHTIGTIGITRNITERKRMEETLRQERTLFRTIIDNIPDPIYAKDAYARKTVANLADVRNIGASSEAEVIGKDDFALFPKEQAEKFHAVDEHVLKTGKPLIDLEDAFIDDAGKIKWLLSSKIPIFDDKGTVTGLVGIGKNITDQKQMEANLRQAQKMEAIGQLAGGVAHDFNNIMAATMMQLSFLKRNTSLDPEAHEILNELMDGAKRAASLTSQLLMFSRRSVLEIQVLDLNEVVANLFKMLSRLIGEHISLRFDRGEALPAVKADARMIEQVVMNLAVNARDAMPKGGLLTIRLESIQIDAQRAKGKIEVQPGLFVCLSVADTGSGMDEATIKRIFEPFFTTKEVGKGTGLGLATIDGIVAQHKGWVDVESELGKGTTFKVFLPATTQGRTEPTTTEKGAVIRGRETILLVEDEAGLRRLVAQGLRMLGYQVLEADNGQTAMKLWQEHGQHIDLLFSDMMMPEGLTGLDLAEKLRRDKTNLKVIISSGYSVETAGLGKPAAGGIVYFQKPYEFEELSKTIRDCLDHR